MRQHLEAAAKKTEATQPAYQPVASKLSPTLCRAAQTNKSAAKKKLARKNCGWLLRRGDLSLQCAISEVVGAVSDNANARAVGRFKQKHQRRRLCAALRRRVASAQDPARRYVACCVDDSAFSPVLPHSVLWLCVVSSTRDPVRAAARACRGTLRIIKKKTPVCGCQQTSGRSTESGRQAA